MKIILLFIMMLIHPVHVSLTGIEYDAMNRVWSVFVKIYSDDLESDIGLGLASGEEIMGGETERYFKYLADRLMITENGRKLNMKLISTEADGIEHRFRLQARGGRKVNEVTVMNRIMIRLYGDQANMLLISFNGIEDGYRFTATDTLKVYKVK